MNPRKYELDIKCSNTKVNHALKSTSLEEGAGVSRWTHPSSPFNLYFSPTLHTPYSRPQPSLVLYLNQRYHIDVLRTPHSSISGSKTLASTPITSLKVIPQTVNY